MVCMDKVKHLGYMSKEKEKDPKKKREYVERLVSKSKIESSCVFFEVGSRNYRNAWE